jgi:hypothetical protein
VDEAFGAVWVVGAPLGVLVALREGGAPFWAVWGRCHPFGALVGPGGVGTSFWSDLLCSWALGTVGALRVRVV